MEGTPDARSRSIGTKKNKNNKEKKNSYTKNTFHTTKIKLAREEKHVLLHEPKLNHGIIIIKKKKKLIWGDIMELGNDLLCVFAMYIIKHINSQ